MDTSTPEPASTLTIPEALAAAIDLQKQRRLPEAREIYDAILAVDPQCAEALHFLGVLLHQDQESGQAVEMICRALALRPDYADAQCNLGNVLLALGRFIEAAVAFDRVIGLAPRHLQAHNNLGVALKAMGRFDDAAAVLRRAIEIDPTASESHFNLGNVLARQDRNEESFQEFRRAIELFPTYVHAYITLGRTLRQAGKHAESMAVFRRLVEIAPDNALGRHMLAAESGENIPTKASEESIQQLFDDFSETFDGVLAALQYKAPSLVATAVITELFTRKSPCDILDAGCGTGLCGPLLKPHTRRLVGVDLSPGMLAKARLRNVYDQLIEAELTEYLQGHPGTCDVIVSADTLNYFGDLSAPLIAAARALRDGGLMVFTLEDARDAAGDLGFRLDPHGRYLHDETYLRNCLERAGFTIGSLSREVLRTETGEPVIGLLVVARKPGSTTADPKV